MFSFWSSLSWADCRDICGLLLVAIGVAGDLFVLSPLCRHLLNIPYNPTNFEPLESRKKILEYCCTGLIVIGLVLELSAWPQHIKVVVSLQNENLKLQKELQPRRITIEQRTNFIELVKYVPKIPITIDIPSDGFDTEDFANDMRQMFSAAGFKTNSDAGYLGISRSRLIGTGIADDTNEPEVWFAIGRPKSSYPAPTPFGNPYTLRNEAYVKASIHTNEWDVFLALDAAFRIVGIKHEIATAPEFPSNQCVIVIPIKP